MTQPVGMYTTQLQAGLGLVHETRLLLDIWQVGMTPNELKHAALKSGQFPTVSARRLRNVVIECFSPRYLVQNGEPANYLKRLNATLSTSELVQLFFLYTCRANLILANFIRQVYWEQYAAGSTHLAKEDVKAFIRRGIDDGKMIKRWAESTITRVSNYLIGCCADYGLLGRLTRAGRQIVVHRIEPTVAAYLAHDLHFAGLGDNAVASHQDWQLFGMNRDDVREELKRLSLKGYFIHQSAGNVTHISWKYKTMEEFVDVLAQG